MTPPGRANIEPLWGSQVRSRLLFAGRDCESEKGIGTPLPRSRPRVVSRLGQERSIGAVVARKITAQGLLVNFNSRKSCCVCLETEGQRVDISLAGSRDTGRVHRS